MMGGYGSGRYGYGSKMTTEESKEIDIRLMKKRNSLNPGYQGIWSWSCRDEHSGSISYKTHEDKIELHYSIGSDGDKQEINQSIYLGKTACNYGGHRNWFICPWCGYRCEVIYLHQKYFKCRKCADLAYWSQQEGVQDRMYRKARKIRKKLIPKQYPDYYFNPNDMTDRPIFKPKGMHQKTFDRLRYKQEKLALDVLMIGVSKLGSLGEQIMREIKE